MLSGRRLDLTDPSPVDVEISDIAHGLARVARWNGQTRGDNAYSVAQHSCLVLDVVDTIAPGASTQKRMMALLHDAPEFVVGDLISPFKAVIGGEYKMLEERLLAAVHLRYGLPPAPPAIWKKVIKKADTIAAFYEATQLAGFSESEARQFFGNPDGYQPPDQLIKPLPAREAEALFLDAFNRMEQALTAAQ
ncbi:MAG: HD family hydrolase [Nitratireductor sp.]